MKYPLHNLSVGQSIRYKNTERGALNAAIVYFKNKNPYAAFSVQRLVAPNSFIVTRKPDRPGAPDEAYSERSGFYVSDGWGEVIYAGPMSHDAAVTNCADLSAATGQTLYVWHLDLEG